VIEKKIYRILAIMLIFSLGLTSVPGLFVPTPAYALNEKLTTAIVSIECPSENDLPVRINSALSAAMVKSHRFEVTDSEQVASTLKDMQLTGKKLNITQACEVGKALGVETVTMVQGYGIQSDNEKCYITLAVQVVDVNTGIVCQSSYAVGEGFKGEKFELTDEAIKNGSFSLVNQINDNMSKVGLIAIIKGGEISLNVGGDIGIKTETEFAVYRENRIIGKLKVKELDTYDCYVEKIAILPGLNFNEGDIVVVAKNQGDELVGFSPSTIPGKSSTPGIILASVLIGTALAIIASNQSSQIQELAMVYRFQTQFVRHEGNLAVFLVTIQVTDHNGNLLPDGTTVTYKKASDSLSDTVGFGNAMAVQEEVKTFGGIASTIVWTETGSALGDNTLGPGIFIRSEGRDSQNFYISRADAVFSTLAISTTYPGTGTAYANGTDKVEVKATITAPTNANIPVGSQIVFQITGGTASTAVFSESGSKQYTTTVSAADTKANIVSTTEGTVDVMVQLLDMVQTTSVTFGTIAVKTATVAPEPSAMAVGVSTSHVVTVTGSDDKPLSGVAVSFSTQGAGAASLGISPSSGNTLANGTFSFILTNNRAPVVLPATPDLQYVTLMINITYQGTLVQQIPYTFTLSN
jgi:hypothetical protein